MTRFNLHQKKKKILILGEIESNIENNPQNNALNISSPPPGLDRMVLGQITENESQVASESNSRRANQSKYTK